MSTARVRDQIVLAMAMPSPMTIRFTYTGADNTESSRHVEPYEIRGGILFAHCLDRDAIRQFKLERMQDVFHGTAFVPRHPIVMPM